MTEAEEEAINKKRSNKTAAKFTTRQKTAAVSTINYVDNLQNAKRFFPASHDACLLSADELKFDLQTCGLSLNDQKERYVLSLQ